MKLYVGYEYKPNSANKKIINMGTDTPCFITHNLKAMQDRIDTYGLENETYTIYKVEINIRQIAEALDNTISDCMPPDEDLVVLETREMSESGTSP